MDEEYSSACHERYHKWIGGKMNEIGKEILIGELKWLVRVVQKTEVLTPPALEMIDQIHKLIEDSDKPFKKLKEMGFKVDYGQSGVQVDEIAIESWIIKNENYFKHILEQDAHYIVKMREEITKSLKQLLQSQRVVNSDIILKIFDIYDEPETIPWKIATVKELLQSKVDEVIVYPSDHEPEMVAKYELEIIAKDLVIMIGEQGQTEEGVIKYLKPILRSHIKVVK